MRVCHRRCRCRCRCSVTPDYLSSPAASSSTLHLQWLSRAGSPAGGNSSCEPGLSTSPAALCATLSRLRPLNIHTNFSQCDTLEVTILKMCSHYNEKSFQVDTIQQKLNNCLNNDLDCPIAINLILWSYSQVFDSNVKPKKFHLLGHQSSSDWS